MGIEYLIHGKVMFKVLGSEVEALINNFTDIGENLREDNPCNMVHIHREGFAMEFSVEGYMSHSVANDLLDTVVAMGQFLAEPAVITYRYEGSTEQQAVGPQSPAWLESWMQLRTIEGLLGYLTREHLASLNTSIRKHINSGEFRRL